MRLFLAFAIIAFLGTIYFPAFADDDDSWREDIKSTSQNGVTTKDGRDYYYENGTIVENPHLKGSAVNLRNVFDFTDSLVYQQDADSLRNASTTAFTQMDQTRIAYVRNIGCYIVKKRGASNPNYSSSDLYNFYKNFCADAE